MMNFNDYQKRAIKTAIYPTDYRMVYPALGLAGESGEVCEKVKKHLRGDDSPNLRKDIEKELGDVLWYVANLASDLGLHLDNIATKNLDKLRDRQRRDALQGDGDER